MGSFDAFVECCVFIKAFLHGFFTVPLVEGVEEVLFFSRMVILQGCGPGRAIGDEGAVFGGKNVL